MKLVYIGHHDAVDGPFGTAIRGGEPVEVEADLGKSLVDRGDFARPSTKAAAKAADIPAPDLADLTAPIDPATAEKE